MSSVRSCPHGHSWSAAADLPETCPICSVSANDSSKTASFAPTAVPNATAALRGPQAVDAMLGGKVIAGHVVLGELGRGGMGVVYQAHHLQLDRIVALKMILAGGHADASQRQRFQSEAQAIARLQHPNIVQVYEVGEHEGLPYFAFEYCGGGSLGQKLAGTPLPPKQAAALVESLARAMHAAHQKGILHRDLKPANVLLAADGTPKITDFGLAKKLDEAGQTTSGAVVGTPSYMAPEQAAGNLPAIGPASDVYALGAILYECLTGRPPFRAAHALDTLLQVVHCEPVPPRQLNGQVPRDLETICLKCLHKLPARRFGSALALADDLRRFGAGEPIAARPVGRLERAVKWVRRHPARALAAAVLLASALALTAGLFWYQDEQNRLALDEHRRIAEAERKLALAEDAIGHALDQAADERRKLLAILHEPGGVFALLNDPARWQGHVSAAQAALERAEALRANAEGGAGDTVGARLADLQALVRQDHDERLLAVHLEKIHLDTAEWVAGQFDVAKATQGYAQAFAGAGFAVLEKPAAAVAARLRAAPIREQLVAALDHWAWVEYVVGDPQRVDALLAVSRRADPDPAWADRLRHLDVWRDDRALAELAREAPVARRSPQLLWLMGHMLGLDKPAGLAWARQTQAEYPTDFWLNYGLGIALRQSNPTEAAGFYRAAIAIRPSSSAAYNNLGDALAMQHRPDEAIAAYRRAIALDADHAFAHCNLGGALLGQQKLPEAIAAFRDAIRCAPKLGMAHSNLATALFAQGQLPEAMAACREAIAVDPKCAHAHCNLGILLWSQDRRAEAVAAFQAAVAADPKFADAQFRLGTALTAQRKLDEAVTALKQAIAIDPNLAAAHAQLGYALAEQQRWPEASAALDKAITLDPKDGRTRGALGLALLRQGSFTAAAKATREALDLVPAGTPLRGMVQRQLDDCQALLALDERAARVLDGKESAGPADLLKMARMCREHGQRHVRAVELYRLAFKARPPLAEDASPPHSSDAATAAVLASAGRGDEAARLSADQKAELRRQAHAWLRADLDACTRQLKDGKPDVIVQVVDRLSHWQGGAELAAVRDAGELAGLPEPERAAWEKLWTDVASSLGTARGRFAETRLENTLTTQEKTRADERRLVAGRTYVIDLESTAFDALLRLQDVKGKVLAENDDIEPGVNLNARLVFTASADGVYQLIATSFQEAGTGPYTLRIREFQGGK
jgi:serine/threonine-protein kinase